MNLLNQGNDTAGSWDIDAEIQRELDGLSECEYTSTTSAEEGLQGETEEKYGNENGKGNFRSSEDNGLSNLLQRWHTQDEKLRFFKSSLSNLAGLKKNDFSDSDKRLRNETGVATGPKLLNLIRSMDTYDECNVCGKPDGIEEQSANKLNDTMHGKPYLGKNDRLCVVKSCTNRDEHGGFAQDNMCFMNQSMNTCMLLRQGIPNAKNSVAEIPPRIARSLQSIKAFKQKFDSHCKVQDLEGKFSEADGPDKIIQVPTIIGISNSNHTSSNSLDTNSLFPSATQILFA
eukprot:Gb_31754 [translate_table: standard]